MPKDPSWSEKVPQALEVLAEEGDDDLITPKWIELHLGVKIRQAQMICRQVGKAVGAGKNLGVLVKDMRLFLEISGKVELERRKNLARRLQQLEQERKKAPPLWVDTEPIAPLQRKVEKGGFAALPEGIILQAGKLEVEFRGEVDLMQKMCLLVAAMRDDQAGLLERIMAAI